MKEMPLPYLLRPESLEEIAGQKEILGEGTLLRKLIVEDKVKSVIFYGPPGTGKTLLARAIACQIDSKFLKVVASSIVDKYIGESARVIREMFAYAKENQPCIIFMDEIDAIGGKRLSDGSSADREI